MSALIMHACSQTEINTLLEHDKRAMTSCPAHAVWIVSLGVWKTHVGWSITLAVFHREHMSIRPSSLAMSLKLHETKEGTRRKWPSSA